ncbi:PREDICTED: translation initiation factor IF-2-like isoform X2 [Hipposideros armiger]|uniref:Translation initiation factor IF-2-like isoform X2 n=1 Tax=Hipposideros armiger TaxID=186990 RepID=A0A8B7QRU9_HIPAR|nr:PREDICTED: translation initiation factor IF-2-like isoform X2 [Hipposideros armiger]
MSKSTTGTVRRKVGERALEWTSESGSRSSASRHVHRRTRGALGAAQRGRGSGILPRPVLGCSAPRPLPSAAPPTCGPCAPPLQPIPAAPTPCCCSAPRRPLRLQPPRPPRCGPGGPRSPRPCPARGPRPAPRRFLAPGTDPRDTGWPGRGEAGSGVVPGGGTQGPIRRGAARCGPPGDTPWPVPFRPPTRPILFTFSFFKVGGIGSGLGGGPCSTAKSVLNACLHLPTRALQPPAPSMQLQDSGVQYSRWDDSSRDEVSVAAVSSTEEASSWERFSQKLRSGKLGLAMKALGGMAVFWAVFILGYITSYFVHKCK